MVGSRLNVNLNDPDDVRKKLPKVRAALEEKQREVDAWSDLVKTLEFIASADASAGSKDTSSTRQSSSRRQSRSAGSRSQGSQSPAKDAVVRVITEHNRPMRAPEVASILNRERNAVNAAMWGAAKAGRLRALGEGQYAPPGWQSPAEPNLLASTNGSGPGANEAELPPEPREERPGVPEEHPPPY